MPGYRLTGTNCISFHFRLSKAREEWKNIGENVVVLHMVNLKFSYVILNLNKSIDRLMLPHVKPILFT